MTEPPQASAPAAVTRENSLIYRHIVIVTISYPHGYTIGIFIDKAIIIRVLIDISCHESELVAAGAFYEGDFNSKLKINNLSNIGLAFLGRIRGLIISA